MFEKKILSAINNWPNIGKKINKTLDGPEVNHVHDPATWPKESKLAASGEWEILRNGRKNSMQENNLIVIRLGNRGFFMHKIISL